MRVERTRKRGLLGQRRIKGRVVADRLEELRGPPVRHKRDSRRSQRGQDLLHFDRNARADGVAKRGERDRVGQREGAEHGAVDVDLIEVEVVRREVEEPVNDVARNIGPVREIRGIRDWGRRERRPVAIVSRLRQAEFRRELPCESGKHGLHAHRSVAPAGRGRRHAERGGRDLDVEDQSKRAQQGRK